MYCATNILWHLQIVQRYLRRIYFLSEVGTEAILMFITAGDSGGSSNRVSVASPTEILHMWSASPFVNDEWLEAQ
ncbi:hypothetical protein BD410DRAFT_797146 [Rickenella mellea]|uniref:Uncharacterized protein n=1 Tax=Rickenella mellea TaxID=50990 RepID=A0A4Y7PJC9_9AGAM|nr:hypothetical protein BD410DRAFT_797146 [Rickenella mellea]